MKRIGSTAKSMLAGGMVGLLLVAWLAVVPAQAQVLDQIPSNAVAVFKINHLQDTSKKMAELMQALGVTDFAPVMSDPIKALEDELGISKGVNTAGDGAIVLLNGPWPSDMDKLDDDGKETPPPLVVLVPVSDYKAFLSNGTVVKTDGDITTMHFKKEDEPEDTYVTQWGDYAAISPLKQSVSKKPTGLKVAGLAARELNDKDVVAYVNWPVLKTLLLPKLQESRAKILANIDKGLNKADKDLDAGAPDASKSAVVKAVVNRVLDLAEGFMEQSQATTFGYSFSKSGVSGTMLMEFTPNSYMGQLAHAIKTTDQPLLSGLPGDKYLVYGGLVQDPKLAVKVFSDLVGPVSKQLAAMGEKGKVIQNAIDVENEMLGAVNGISGGWVAPDPNQMGQTGVVQCVAVYKGDAAKLQATQVKGTKAWQDAMEAFGLRKSAQMKQTITENAKTVDGVKFNRIETQVNLQGNSPEQMQADQFMKIMYGPNGIDIYSGMVNPQTILLTIGGSDQLLTSSVAAIKANTDAITATEAMKSVDAELPKTRAAAVYIPLDVIVSTAVGYAGKFGFPVPVQLPPNLPPIGITAGTEGSAIRVDGFIPTPLVQSLIQAGMQTYLQMQGNHGNGGGGGL